jgi:hypothetical protein
MGWRILAVILLLTAAFCALSVLGDHCEAAGGHIVRYQGCMLP